uniref:Putative secreted protein n=1 Tax=Anopheles triannulatus TaxID=58253 RepID=A0A2M4B5G2_9DIPT
MFDPTAAASAGFLPCPVCPSAAAVPVYHLLSLLPRAPPQCPSSPHQGLRVQCHSKRWQERSANFGNSKGERRGM